MDDLRHLKECKAALEWIVAFMNEHPEWVVTAFAPEANMAEAEWLEHARELIG